MISVRGKIYIFCSLTLILFILGSTGQSYTQTTPVYFNHLTRDNGLSSNRINCITEDSLGFIWFGTEEGLDRFDGYSIQRFDNLPSKGNNTPDNAINYILEDIQKPNLWLASNQGLIYFNRFQGSFSLLLDKELRDSQGQILHITSLGFDKNKNLWIGTTKGLFSWDNTKRIFKILLPDNQENSSYINTIYKDHSGKIWVGTMGGLYGFSVADSSFHQYYPGEIESVIVIRQDRRGNFMIGTNTSGLYFINGKPGNKIIKQLSKENGYLVSNRIYGIIEEPEDHYFILNRDGGLFYYDRQRDKMTYYGNDIHNPEGLNSTALISGLKSSQGIIWLGTFGNGINYYDKANKKFMLYKVNFREDGLFNNNIRALAEDSEGFIWVGTKEGGGLSRFDKQSGLFRNYKKNGGENGLRADYIFSICELDANRLLIGTFRNGLAIFNKKKETFSYYTHRNNDTTSLFDNRIYIVYKDSEGTIWLGNHSTLQIFHPGSKSFQTVHGISGPRCICEDSNKIWVGSQFHGIYLLDKQTGKIINYHNDPADSNCISSNDIYALTKDSKGNLWIGTKQGLNKLDPVSGIFVRYTKKDGLAANWIRGLLTDSRGHIWASTTNGISQYDPEKNTFHNYDVKDHLQGNEFERYVQLKTHDGYMLFGGNNGLNVFKPEQITDNKRIPRVYITGISLLNVPLTVQQKDSPLEKEALFTKNLCLHYNQTALTFHFVALNYTSSGKNRYAYILEGFDNDWIRAGTRRTATYTNIPPGTYTFRVIGSNNDGYWNKTGASLIITILPPPWRTPWAYLTYFFLFTLIFLGIRRILIIRIKQKQLLEFERKDKKRIQEINQEKLRFFTNITHEFRTPLTLISGPLNKLLTQDGLPADTGRHLLKIMQNNVKRLLLLVNEIMDFRKAEQGLIKLKVSENNIRQDIQEIVESFEVGTGEKNIDLILNTELEHPVVWYDRNIIFKVVFNLLSNAIKFTPEGGKITVELSRRGGNYIQISVANTGESIPAHELSRIFERFYRIEDHSTGNTGSGIGLTIVKRLIEVHKGSITVNSDPGTMTTFTVIFPAGKEHFSSKETLPENQKITNEHIVFNPVYNNQKQEIPHITDKKILIVEDNPELREYLEDVFPGYSVLTASDGNIGWEKAKTEMPDCIISDIMMPGMDGIALCDQIKTHTATSHIPVILLTAKVDIEHKIKGIKTGADAYIEKPFHTEYLEAVVANLIGQREKLRKRFSGETEWNIDEAALTENDKQFIEKTKKIIDDNIGNSDFSVEDLGNLLGLSRSQLFRKFNALFDLTPNELLKSQRLKYAKVLLQRGYNVNETAEMAGFSSNSYFITSFKKYYGYTPSRLHKKG